jgi:hypothetical protein
MKIDSGKSVEREPALPVAEWSLARNEFHEEAERMKNDITDLMYQGQFLRDEAARAVVWSNQGRGKHWWGEAQEAHLASSLERLRTAAAAWKTAVDARGPNSAGILRQIFEPKHSCQFDQQVVDAARKELAI